MKDAEGRFYFWRNGFLAVVGVIFGCIGGSYMYMNLCIASQNDRIVVSERAQAVMQVDIDYIKKSVNEQKETSKEILSEVKGMKK
jgi:hypothetical protein